MKCQTKRSFGYRSVFWRVALLAATLLIGVESRAGSGLVAMDSGPASREFDRLASEPGRWRRWAAGEGRGGPATAVARFVGGDAAIGDLSGVSWLPSTIVSGSPHAVRSPRDERDEKQRAVLPSVTALAFDSDGELWIGTFDGLYRWSRTGRPLRRPLRGGETARSVRDLAVAGDALLVGTGAGAYWSTSGEIFQPLESVSVATPVDRVAIRSGLSSLSRSSGAVAPGQSVEVWLASADDLTRLSGRVTTSGLRVLGRGRISLPRPRSEQVVVDLDLDESGSRLAVVYPDLLAILNLETDSTAKEAVQAAGGWELFRPVLAPGARIRSFDWMGDAVVLATDHGVFVAGGPGGPFVRSADPVGTGDCIESEWTSLETWIALCRSGLYEYLPGRSRSRPLRSSMPDSVSGRTGADLISVHEPLPLGLDPRSQGELGALSLPPDPPLEEIRRRAFERAGLSARRSAELWSGLRHRAYWPDLELRFGVDFDRDDQRDSDEAFVSGLTRHLRDSRSDRGESYEGSIVLDWDLGGLAYPADSVDLSRELRQIVSLRDDVADELNQLYFERQRLRASLDRPSELAPEEAERLHWRAREIDAGLDAWTGGWVARWRVDRGGGEVEALAPAPLGSDP